MPVPVRPPATMTLLDLETLPCGCVAGIYQASADVEVEVVEAKGPHCAYPWHAVGEVTRLSLPEESLAALDAAAAA